MSDTARAHTVAWGSPRARWVLAAAVLGSGMAFLDGTIVNVALPEHGQRPRRRPRRPAMGSRRLPRHADRAAAARGRSRRSLGRRRVFTIGVGVFAAASVLCGVAPTTGALIAARRAAGSRAARCSCPAAWPCCPRRCARRSGRAAIGAWSGLTGVASAVGPFFGGWLVDAASWRWAFLINVPLAVVVLGSPRGVPESIDAGRPAAPRSPRARRSSALGWRR